MKSDLEITPEPSPLEAAAIRLVVERMLRASDAPAPYLSRWRARGLLENLGADSRDGAAAQ